MRAIAYAVLGATALLLSAPMKASAACQDQNCLDAMAQHQHGQQQKSEQQQQAKPPVQPQTMPAGHRHRMHRMPGHRPHMGKHHVQMRHMHRPRMIHGARVTHHRRHAGHHDWRRHPDEHRYHTMHSPHQRSHHHHGHHHSFGGHYGIGYSRPAFYDPVVYNYGYNSHYAFRPGLIHALMHGAGHWQHHGPRFAGYGRPCRSFYIPYDGTWYRATNC